MAKWWLFALFLLYCGMNKGTYRLPDPLHKGLIRLKKKKGIPISSLIKLAVSELLKKEDN